LYEYKIIGFFIFYNSESIVLSYASIFEVLYNQSILFQQLKDEENIKNEFVNIAAHDLPTPLMPILNGIEILEEKLGERKYEYRQVMDMIIRNTSRLQNLADSVLQASRIKRGNFNIHLQNDIYIHHLILQAIEDIEKKYMYTDKAKNVSIIFEPFYNIKGQKKKIKKVKYKESNKKIKVVTELVEKEHNHNVISNNKVVYPSPSPFYVNCDPQKISQVVFNLLDNAMKFSTKGKIFISTTFLINGKEQHLKYHKNTKDTKTHNS
jgi:signal transduction histidine kinase